MSISSDHYDSSLSQSDSQHQIFDESSDFRSQIVGNIIFRIKQTEKKRRTGILISKKYILTIVNNNLFPQNQLQSITIQFYPGSLNPQTQQGHKIKKDSIMIKRNSQFRSQMAQYDYALFQLEKQMKLLQLEPIQLSTPTSNKLAIQIASFNTFFNQSHEKQKKFKLFRSKKCKIVESTKELRYKPLMVNGVIGSPIFVKNCDKYQIIGLHAKDCQFYGWGLPLNNEIQQLIIRLRRQENNDEQINKNIQQKDDNLIKQENSQISKGENKIKKNYSSLLKKKLKIIIWFIAIVMGLIIIFCSDKINLDQNL